MPAKKKKGSKKKKKSSAAAEKPVDEGPKTENEPPAFRDPVFEAPVATIIVQLANPPNGMFREELQMRVSNRLYMLQEEIKRMHGGSINNIRICLAQYVDDQAYTDPMLTLREIGMATEGPFNVFYDYGVTPKPILTTPFNYKIID